MTFNLVKKWLFLAALFLPLSFAAAQNGKPQPKLESAVFTIQKEGGGSQTVTAELARTEEQKMRGLMFRKTLADGEGMLFIYDRDVPMSFWMKNTQVPLSIAYISRAGIIIDIFDMEPLSTRTVRGSRAARYALEVPQGWFARNGIAEGDRLSPLP
ncbi:MAG: DUF192 domain-containing protein [Spirochaetaceae bacterium]|jgi:uncharacterized membrane protein (UPF0127 family)|nr:DUF192 domain-containing protein [Spirochaetaceae bacterium]